MANANLVVTVRCVTEDGEAAIKVARETADRALAIAREQTLRATRLSVVAFLAGALLCALVLLPGCSGAPPEKRAYLVRTAGGERCIEAKTYFGEAYSISQNCVMFESSEPGGIKKGPIFCGSVDVERVPECPRQPADAR